jgi:hypothetical protein
VGGRDVGRSDTRGAVGGEEDRRGKADSGGYRWAFSSERERRRGGTTGTGDESIPGEFVSHFLL